MRRISLLLAAGLFFSGTAFSAEELKISGGVSAVQNVFTKVTAAFEKETGIKVVYTNKDPKGQGGDAVFKEVDGGVAEAGASGAVWEDWQKMMKEKGYEAKHGDKMKSRVFGRDRIQFMTYKGGPKKLSEEQLKGILTGKHKNWKEVGGENLPITLILSEDQPSTGKFLEERYLDGQKINKDNHKMITKAQGIGEMVKTIAATKGAIGFGPVNLVDKTVNVPEYPPVGRPLTMMWIGEPSKNLLKFFDFIEKKGPKLGVVQ